MQQFGNASAIVGADEEAARPLKNMTEPLARKADRRGVNQRLDFIDVVGHDTEEQSLVAVVQPVQRHVFFQVVRQAAQIGHHALGLRLHGKHMRRQQTAQSKRVALLLGEGRALVEKRIAQQRHPVRVIGIARRSGRPVEPVHGNYPSKIKALIKTSDQLAGPWRSVSGCAMISWSLALFAVQRLMTTVASRRA